MQAIEVDAGRRFAEIGMVAIAEDPPPPDELLLGHIDDGTAWIAETTESAAVGYAIASTVDDEGHLDQVSVVQDAIGRGIGRALIDRVAQWTLTEGMTSLTLTTFRDVEWNGPLYEHLGFETIDETELLPGLAAIRQTEISAGLDVSPRQSMRLILGAG